MRTTVVVFFPVGDVDVVVVVDIEDDDEPAAVLGVEDELHRTALQTDTKPPLQLAIGVSQQAALFLSILMHSSWIREEFKSRRSMGGEKTVTMKKKKKNRL